MRGLRFLLSVTLYTVWYGTKVVVAALAGVRQRAGGLYDQCQRRWARGLLRTNRISLRIEGIERLTPGRPVVFVSNHASFLDIWALLDGLPGTIRFVFKKELLRVPIFGGALRGMRHIQIDRTNRSSAFASYDEAAVSVRTGISAVVFAEGTRSRTGKLLPFKKGPFVLGIAAQVPIVPVFCADTFERLPKGSVSPKPGEITLKLGEPISTEGLTYDARDQLAARARREMLALGARE